MRAPRDTRRTLPARMPRDGGPPAQAHERRAAPRRTARRGERGVRPPRLPRRLARRDRVNRGRLQGADLRALREQARAPRRAGRAARGRDLPAASGQHGGRCDRARSACAAASTRSSAFVEENRDAWRALFRDASDPEVTEAISRVREQAAGVVGALMAADSAARARRQREAARSVLRDAGRSCWPERSRCSRTGGPTIRASRARPSSTARWSSAGSAWTASRRASSSGAASSSLSALDARQPTLTWPVWRCQ